MSYSKVNLTHKDFLHKWHVGDGVILITTRYQWQQYNIIVSPSWEGPPRHVNKFAVLHCIHMGLAPISYYDIYYIISTAT